MKIVLFSLRCFFRDRSLLCPLIAALALLLFHPVAVHAAAPKDAPCVVAVIDFENETASPGNASLAKSVTNTVTTGLVKSGSLKVVERSRLKGVLDEQKLMLSGLIDTSALANVGKLLAADNIVIGSLSSAGKKWVVNARVLEVKTGRVLASEMFEAGDRKKLLKMSERLTADLIRVISHYQKKTNVRIAFLARPRDEKRTRLTPEEEQQTKNVLRKKIEGYGGRLRAAAIDGERLSLRVQEVTEPLLLAKMLMGDDVLEFRLVDDSYSPESKTLPPGTGLISCNFGGRNEDVAAYENPIMTGNSIATASVSIDRFNNAIINMAFDREGAATFESVTGQNIQKMMAIVLNGTCLTAPRIMEKISGGKAQITGVFTMEEAFRLSVSLTSGRMPARLSLEGIDTDAE